jgi:hypothetical protein
MSAAALRIYGTRHPVTVEDAQHSYENYTMLWKHGRDIEHLYQRLGEHRNQMEALTRHHLQLRKETITVAPCKEWIHGTFNLCIPIEVNYGHACRQFMFRCPMPHKNAEAQYEGTVNEKMSCEVGAYVWIQEKCPKLRQPCKLCFSTFNMMMLTQIVYTRDATTLVYPISTSYTSPSPSSSSPPNSFAIHSPSYCGHRFSSLIYAA